MQDGSNEAVGFLGTVIDLGDIVTLTTGGLDSSTEGKRNPYD